MKAISVWQPWASLVACGAKRIETRGWETSYRGPLAIHAAKKWDGELRETLRRPIFRGALHEVLGWHQLRVLDSHKLVNVLPHGMVLCVVDLVNCVPIERAIAAGISLPEYQYGNYAPGRYAWKLENVRPLTPFEFKGRQGFFEVPDEMVAAAGGGR